MPRLFKLYQTPLILRMAIQCAALLQINAFLLFKSSFYPSASMETIDRFIVLSASAYNTSYTLQNLNAIVTVHGDIATLLLHVLY